jgi:hypothetical protein
VYSIFFSKFSFFLSAPSLELEKFSFSDDDKPKKTATVVLSSATSTAPKKRSQEETMVDKPSQDLQEKVVSMQPIKR